VCTGKGVAINSLLTTLADQFFAAQDLDLSRRCQDVTGPLRLQRISHAFGQLVPRSNSASECLFLEQTETLSVFVFPFLARSWKTMSLLSVQNPRMWFKNGRRSLMRLPGVSQRRRTWKREAYFVTVRQTGKRGGSCSSGEHSQGRTWLPTGRAEVKEG